GQGAKFCERPVRFSPAVGPAPATQARYRRERTLSLLGCRPIRARASGALRFVSGPIQAGQRIAFYPICKALVLGRAKPIYPELIGMVLAAKDVDRDVAGVGVGFNSFLEKHHSMRPEVPR